MGESLFFNYLFKINKCICIQEDLWPASKLLKTMKELLKLLQERIVTVGEFDIEDNEIYWYWSVDSTDDDTQDTLWIAYCETANDVRGILPPEFEIVDGWSDNDSTGFTVRHTSCN